MRLSGTPRPYSTGDEMAGIGPEATRVFGRNAQIAAIPGRLGERVKSAVPSPIEVQKGQVERMPACGCLAAVAQPARTASARREGLARLRADKA